MTMRMTLDASTRGCVSTSSCSMPSCPPRPTSTAGSPRWVTSSSYHRPQPYTSPEFHRLEVERIWKRAWQMACLEEDIPEDR